MIEHRCYEAIVTKIYIGKSLPDLGSMTGIPSQPVHPEATPDLYLLRIDDEGWDSEQIRNQMQFIH